VCKVTTRAPGTCVSVRGVGKKEKKEKGVTKNMDGGQRHANASFYIHSGSAFEIGAVFTVGKPHSYERYQSCDGH